MRLPCVPGQEKKTCMGLVSFVCNWLRLKHMYQNGTLQMEPKTKTCLILRHSLPSFVFDVCSVSGMLQKANLQSSSRVALPGCSADCRGLFW